jgi:ribonuclease Z
MKPAFIHRLINSPFEDPSLFLRIAHEKRALLFDIGNIDKLSPGELQKVSDVFVTHTHIDHFIGFDTLLRALLRRETPLRVYGPAHITECIEGKLRGYAWNLIQEYPLKIEVHCIDGAYVHTVHFEACNSFKRKDAGIRRFEEILLKETVFTVKALEVSHQIPCLAFSIEEDFHLNINKALLQQMDLPVGPWLSEFKKAVRDNCPGDTEFSAGAKIPTLDQLRHIAMITSGQKISYVTDVEMSEENISRITEFVRDSDTLYCEAYFLERDVDRARERFHMTAKTTGRIAQNASVKELVPMHFSPKYRGGPETPGEEAADEFISRPS